jgi:hypothetical protein
MQHRKPFRERERERLGFVWHVCLVILNILNILNPGKTKFTVVNTSWKLWFQAQSCACLHSRSLRSLRCHHESNTRLPWNCQPLQPRQQSVLWRSYGLQHHHQRYYGAVCVIYSQLILAVISPDYDVCVDERKLKQKKTKKKIIKKGWHLGSSTEKLPVANTVLIAGVFEFTRKGF